MHHTEIGLFLLAVVVAIICGGSGSNYVALAAAAISAATTAYAANEQNKNLKQQRNDARTAAALQTRQLGDQAAVETMKRERQAQSVKAAIRAAAAGAGSEFDGSSFEALSTQAEFDRVTNQNIADRSLNNNINRVASGLQATQDELNARRQNLLISGLTGAVQGAQTGMGFYNGLNDAGLITK